MDVVVLLVLVLELGACAAVVLAARRLHARAERLERRQREWEAQRSGLEGLPPPSNPFLTIEIRNAAEVAANQSWAARTFGGFVPKLVVREVASRAATQMRRQLQVQGIDAEVRVLVPSLPEPESSPTDALP